MTKLEIIYDIKEKLKIKTDDDRFTTDYISHLVDVKRTTLIKQAYSNLTKSMPVIFRQELCMPLELVNNISGNSCYGTILRTKNPIPNVINISGREDLYTVRTTDVTHTSYNSIPIERFAFLGHNRFAGSQIYTALGTDNKIYFYSQLSSFKLIESAIVDGVFESPGEANALSCTTVCDELEMQYPIEGYLVNEIVRLIVQELTATITIPEDNKNDSIDDREKIQNT